ncbi:MAG: hypothetical protein J5I93_00140 [Pirellulaceae bacterium]|nr:hypothetical protein [Pirellulaceae bacterium]
MTSEPRFLGVTVLPEYFQYESIDGVLDRLQAIGVTAVATSPYVMEPADEATGSREPPIDAGAGSVRLLDRPLWGRRELWVRTAPSFVPDLDLYAGLAYQPPPVSELTTAQGPLVSQFLGQAKDRGMRVYFQVQAAIPPGYRVQFGGPRTEDLPWLPDGRVPTGRVANNASLASPAVLAYQRALIHDLCRHYPGLDGLRFDWPEYPPYRIDSIFLDFSPHAESAAARLGLDFQRMRAHASQLYARLHGGLTDELLEELLEDDGGRFHLLGLFRDLPGIADWLHLKAQLSFELLAHFRQCMDEAGGASLELSAHAFPPPWNLLSGLDYGRVATVAGSINVKLYGMHWAMMVRFYGEQLLAANPGLSSELLVRVLYRWLDIVDLDPAGGAESVPRDLSAVHYPEPDEPHPGGNLAQHRKIRQAQRAAGRTPVHVLAHGYGPEEDFRQRMQTARQSARHGVWVNRYGYLSDRKLAILAEVFPSGA